MSHKNIEILQNNKIVVILPENKDFIVPLFCPLCDIPMKTLDDSISYSNSKTCNKCELTWSRTIFGNWEEGWRPSKDMEEWIHYINDRKLLARPVFNLR